MKILHTDNVGGRPTWWHNFKDAVWAASDGNFLVTRSEMLAEYGARAVAGGVEFESAEQAAWFILRWA